VNAPSNDFATSAELYDRALRVTPGGVNSPVRAMRSVGRDHPLFIARGAGARVWDTDGNEFVDWVQSWGALPLGHADPEVVEAVQRAAANGSSFGAPTEGEVELAELVCDAVDSVERVRFVSSGTEALMSAIRVARAATGRDAIVTFAGCYHGHADPFLATGGSGMATLSIPSSPGVPAATAADTLVARYNDLASVEQVIGDSGKHIAAIVLEPVGANMGVVPPAPGFLEGLRAMCDRIGALLVFDEVITGFRLGWGGAQDRFGVRPDLTTFGKVIGGGLPVGAFGGRADVMDQVAPAGSVYQAGTLSGNPLAMAAGIATLRALRDRDAFGSLERTGTELATALRGVVDHLDLQAEVVQVGSLVTLFHLAPGAGHAPTDFDEARALDTDRFARMHAGTLDGGPLLPPSQFEALFASTAHTAADIESLAAAVRTAMCTAGGGA
jgi:glutamate-1-semialdehyde 2,1-aminomutase